SDQPMPRPHRRSYVPVLTTMLALTSGLVAQTELQGPSQVLMFKSGHSYTYREVALEPTATSTRLRLPDATHGSAWLASDDVTVTRAIAKREKVTEKRPITDLAGMLRHAIDREVRLSYVAGETVQYAEGKVIRVFDAPPQPIPAYGWRAPTPPQPTPTLVVLQERDSIRTLQVGSIMTVTFAEQEPTRDRWDYAIEIEANVLDVEHSEAAAGDHLGLASMSRRLAWTPSYVIELGDAERARLVGKAVIVNDSEPLRDAQVSLAIGYPNLEFAQVDTSLSPTTTLDAFRNMLESSGANQGRRQAGVLAQTMSNVAAVDTGIGSPPSVAGMAGAVDGESSEDLFLYDVGRITLDKGERAYVPLLDAEVPVAHRFDWDLPDRVNRYAQFTDKPDDLEPVWHVLKLDNVTEAPWTTAPILIRNARGPLAQSMLRYTAAGADATVRLTKALDLVGSSVEVRADDDAARRDEVILFHDRYERVEVVGVLELTNRSKRAAPMRIRKDFSGDLLSADHEPALTGQAKRLGEVNASRTATWTFDLGPGESWKAEYRYKVLIRR
ncbi:MAG: hypothetical protein KDB80_09225, partial [Planctomycetes bacterium]|nr:hypothetical protein [Planctomycetota bacterium]